MNAAALALIAASLLWGTTGTAAHFFTAGVSPLAIGACTMAIGGILLFLVRRRASIAATRDRAARRWVLIGALGVAVYPLAFYSGMNLAGVAIGNVVALGSGPVFAALYEWIWEHRGLSGRWAVATSIAVAGVALLGFAGHEPGSDGSNVSLGVLLGLVAGAAYALYTYSSGRVIRHGHSGGAAMGSTFGAGALVLIPVLLLTGAPILAAPSNLALAAYLALGPMFLAYLFFGIGVARLRGSVVTTVTLLEPLVATILAVIVVGERLSFSGWAGIALIFIGVCIVISARPSPGATVRT